MPMDRKPQRAQPGLSGGDLTGGDITGGNLAGALAELAQCRQELRMFHAALDNVQTGLLILDGDLRAVYSNPVLHENFKAFTVEDIRSRTLFYEDLVRGAASAVAVDLEDYVAIRLAWVRSDDPAPMDMKMTNGTVLRCQLTALPDGGRMLIYSDVTDIMRHAEEQERLATTDGMTGIYNRRHFMMLADREWEKALRYGRPLSFLMMDIDHFKAINDAHGHKIGDEVIVHLAKLATRYKRGSDVLARVGGEEFAILLPETSLKQAQTAAERLRLEIASRPVVAGQLSLDLTVSVGIAEAHPDISSLAELMNAADKALYEAKRTGRNRVVCYAPGSETSIVPSDAVPNDDDARRRPRKSQFG